MSLESLVLDSQGFSGRIDQDRDAMVAEVELRLPAPVAVLTSDVDGMVKLCGRRVRTIAL
ncbi:hypothetical protein ACN261_04330 [Micromonospora sp. WMMD723]|uniref:hypothetical protein n=1 Tax=Micromonospora sp. WMMD723 TaxID=3403465 RepID=UPI003CFAF553